MEKVFEFNVPVKFNSVIIEPNNIVWPSWAKHLVVAWCEDYTEGGDMEEIYVFNKPAAETIWQPKEGEYVWTFFFDRTEKHLIEWPNTVLKNASYAKIIDFHEEATWSFEQFVRRGDVVVIDNK